MKVYGILCEQFGKKKVFVRQYACKNHDEAYRTFVDEFIHSKVDNTILADKLVKEELGVSPTYIKQRKSVWYASFFDHEGLYYMTNIISISPISESLPFYTLVIYFREGTYIYQYSDIDNPEQVLERWAKYINWRYFDKKDRVVIKEKVAQKKFNLSSFGEYVQLFTLTINRIKLCAFVVATRKDKNCNTSSTILIKSGVSKET